MTNEPNFESMTPDERARARKQMADQAVKLAISSRWDEAASLNREYIRVFGEEADALNRLGKSLTEIGRINEAREAYGKTLELEPMNTIARRNLDRLAGMTDTTAASAPPTQLDTRLFIEETGKAAVSNLQAVEAERAALLDAGDLVELQVQGNAVNVLTVTGEYVGMVEPRVGLRLGKMMAAGNQYTAAIVSTSDGDIKVMLRETFQHPSQIGRVSFPQGRSSEVRAYTRRNLLRQPGDEVDYSEDDEPEEEESEEGWSETSDEIDHAPEVDIEPEDESFD